ncbi:MAG: DUF4012 domain-containing protein [bacterium]
MREIGENTSLDDEGMGFESPGSFVVPQSGQFSWLNSVRKKHQRTRANVIKFFQQFRPRKARRIPNLRLKIIYASLSFLVVVLIGSLLQSYFTYRSEVGRFDRSISTLKATFNDANLDGGVSLADTIKNLKILEQSTFKLKLLSESTGQNMSTFGAIGLHSSNLSKRLVLLNSLYQIFSLKRDLDTDAYQSTIGDLASGYLVDGVALRSLIEADLSKALNLFDKIEANLAKNNDAESKDFLKYLDLASAKLKDAQIFVGSDLSFLFDKKTTRNILVIFQNNSELRGGTGGSFGSFGILKINNGKVEKIDFGQNIFKLDNAYRASTLPVIDAPDELKFFSPQRLVLKDSGWAVDGEEAFKNIQKFYNIETGQNIDGVITFDYSAFASLLKVLGPIEMKNYGVTLTADNFKEIVEDEVHNKYFDSEANKAANEPKQILADLMPIALTRMFSYKENPDKLLEVFNSLYSSLKSKNILLYFADQNLENKIKESNFGGTVTQEPTDYLYVNNSNIDGAKSSLSVAQTIDLNVGINSAGEVSNTLSILRKHNGQNILPDGLNKNFVRALLPSGSAVSSFIPTAGNFQQFNDRGYKNGWKYWPSKEADKSVINFWLNTMPQAQSEVNIGYKSGYKVEFSKTGFSYLIDLQRQPGALADNVTLRLNYPKGYQPTNVENYDIVNNVLVLKFNLATDKRIRIDFETNK